MSAPRSGTNNITSVLEAASTAYTLLRPAVLALNMSMDTILMATAIIKQTHLLKGDTPAQAQATQKREEVRLTLLQLPPLLETARTYYHTLEGNKRMLRRAHPKGDRAKKFLKEIMREKEMTDAVLVRMYIMLNVAKGLKALAGCASDAEVVLCPDLIATSKTFFDAMTIIALEQETIQESKAVKSAHVGFGDITEPFVLDRLPAMLENAWVCLIDFEFQAKAEKTMSEGLVQPGSPLDDVRKGEAREIMEELDEVVLQARKDVEELENAVWATKDGLKGL